MLLAAGAGRRAGIPKALRVAPDGTTWVARAASTLHDGGCGRVFVVLGAGASQARRLLEPLPAFITVLEADDWAEGVGRSLAAGMLAALTTPAAALAIHLVDLPDVGPAVLQRLMIDAGTGDDTLARAVYDGRLGHPVLVGRTHVLPMVQELRGDHGGRSYLKSRGVQLVECSDLATGVDDDYG